MSVYKNTFNGYNTYFTVIDDKRKLCSINFNNINNIVLPNSNTCSISFIIPYSNKLEPEQFIISINALKNELINLTELTHTVIMRPNWISNTDKTSIGYVCATPVDDITQQINPVFFKISRNEEFINYTYQEPDINREQLMTDIELQLHLRRALIDNAELIRSNLNILLETKQY